MSGASYHNVAALRAMSILQTALQDMQEELPTQMALAAKSQQDALTALAAQQKQLAWLADQAAQAHAATAAQPGGESHD